MEIYGNPRATAGESIFILSSKKYYSVNSRPYGGKLYEYESHTHTPKSSRNGSVNME